MTDHKSQPLTPSFPEQREERINGTQRYKQAIAERGGPNLVAQDGKDVSGWEAYRRWLSRVQLPDKRRIAMDPALYTWKGYRNWADKVRRDWTPEDK
jgi:hypothetical protein